jgi:hypothetical protein
MGVTSSSESRREIDGALGNGRSLGWRATGAGRTEAGVDACTEIIGWVPAGGRTDGGGSGGGSPNVGTAGGGGACAVAACPNGAGCEGPAIGDAIGG